MRRHKQFWNKEYKRPSHLALSTEPSEDLEKFTRWLGRNFGGVLNPTTMALDLGCGNGRNLIFLAREFGCHGFGIDISAEAISQAKKAAKDLPLEFSARSLAEPLPQTDHSSGLVLDMMSSHILNQGEREKLRDEIWRVLKPGAWLFFKSFLLEEDLHAKRLLKEHPASEPNSYIHPELGVMEHVWSLAEIEEFFTPQFEIHKVEKSHKHLKRPPLRQGFAGRGVPFRRRTVSIYLRKPEF